MNKKKIGTLYGKPIVTGDKNLVSKNEIHKSDLVSSNSENGVQSYYYEIILDEVTAMVAGFINPVEVNVPNGRGSLFIFMGSSDTSIFTAQSVVAETIQGKLAVKYHDTAIVNFNGAIVTLSGDIFNKISQLAGPLNIDTDVIEHVKSNIKILTEDEYLNYNAWE